MKYRKRPVVVDTMRIPIDGANGERDMETWGAICIWLGTSLKEITDDLGIDIFTLEGVIHASPGDIIIKGVKGEFYPCKPDIFDLTYEKVDE